MEAIRNLIERLVETFKNAAASQQESKYVIAIREKYQELSPTGQRITLWTSIAIVTMMVLYFPASNLMDAMDQSEAFNQRRQSLRELLKVVRDASSSPSMRPVPTEPILKSQVDGQLAQMKIRPDQIKNQPGQVPPGFGKVATTQVGYKLERVTIRQVIDAIFAIEQGDVATKVTDLQVNADSKDPHYYNAQFNVVSFGPKMAQVSGLGEALKGNKPGSKDGAGDL